MIQTPVGPWRWALVRSDLPATEQHVALVLAVRMDADGTIPRAYNVGAATLAEDAGRKPRTVMRALRVLVDRGWLELVEPSAGTRPARYRATIPSDASTGTTSDASTGTTDDGLAVPLRPLAVPLGTASGAPRGTQPASSTTPAWQAAWSQVRAEVTRIGARPGYADDRSHFDPTIEDTIASLGGWRAVCELDERRGAWEFRDAYQRRRAAS